METTGYLPWGAPVRTFTFRGDADKYATELTRTERFQYPPRRYVVRASRGGYGVYREAR